MYPQLSLHRSKDTPSWAYTSEELTVDAVFDRLGIACSGVFGNVKAVVGLEKAVDERASWS